MKFEQKWNARAIDAGQVSPWFAAKVPGNVQSDYGRFMDFGDVGYGTNPEKFHKTEGWQWEYRTELQFAVQEGEKLFFVSEGIDYRFDILLNGEKLLEHEGMFTRIELDLTDRAKPGDALSVLIYPHPKREGAPKDDRIEADQSVKPPVCYSWDWHPRLLVSGLWNDTYLETRGKGYIRSCEPFATLNADRSKAEILFETDCDEQVEIRLFDAQGKQVGSGNRITLQNPHLWWCNGQGEPYLYRWTAMSTDDCREGTIGLRTVELVMGEGTWAEPVAFPKSRSSTPIQLVLNGRAVFAKGSNWVNPEIFTGEITDEIYEQHIRLAKEANMNIFRCWGGSGINKKAFYEICDRMGIMLWVEFPLACNNYVGSEHYLTVLEQEASAIIKSLRSHASVVLWCGGNELFNDWSQMTDQSLALRLLNKLCYELDRDRPFLMTSPLIGMGHGGYTFYDPDARCDCFELFQKSHNTAYTEFGVPGMPDADRLREFIPQEEIFPIERTPSWLMHHAFNAWGAERWLCLGDMQNYSAEPLDTLEKVVGMSQWLQCEGYKAIFEEARRQAPYCSMAINWCYCEPWPCAANNSLIAYPITPKKAYYAVQAALRPALFSARIPHFDWKAGDVFSAEIWLLNDSTKEVQGDVCVWIELDGERYDLLKWSASSSANLIGPTVHWKLPDVQADRCTLHLDCAELSSSYTLCYRPSQKKAKTRQMNV